MSAETPQPRFAHLHTHSHYSLLDGLSQIKPLISRVKELGMSAVALTDHGNLHGAVEFYKEAKSAGIKPIIGMEAYVAPGSLKHKRNETEDVYNHLILLAKDLTGYKNLMKLSSIGFLEGFYYKPRIDKEVLREYSKGLIASSACLGGEIAKELVRTKDILTAEQKVQEFLEIFGEGNFFLELQDHRSYAPVEEVNQMLIQLSQKTSVPLIVTKDSHYIFLEDSEAQDIMVCIASGKTVEDKNRLNMTEIDLSISSPEEVAEHFSEMPEVLENTAKIADRCELEIELGKWYFPPIPKEEGKTHDDMLKDFAFEGCQKLLGEVSETHRARLEYELDIIKQKGYAEYFLAVADYASWSRGQGIVVTTRGSAAGSFVSYCVGIVSVNPLTYQLPFERFLNPSRPSAPDVDFDIQDDRRSEVLDYITEKYGKDRVAQICTFGTMAARASVKDVGRALGYPYAFCDTLAKLIPIGSQGFPMTIDRAIADTPELKKMYDTDPQARRLIDLAKKVEGCVRHSSVHAAGVVISPDELTEHVPLQREPGGGDKLVTQYEMNAVGEYGVGLLKHDFLGIRNLSILGNAIRLVKKTKNVEIDLYKIPLDDAKTFDLLAKGNTVGVFQLSGSGITKYLKDLRPSKVTDIMAMVALYRPGPIDSIPEFIKRKHNPDLVTYLHPKLKDILKDSYGLLTYQDDVMLTAIELANYDWMEADKFRKAMGKKIPEEMAKQKDKFFSGCRENAVSEQVIETLWKQIEPFAAYGFNKAHACSYGMVAYQTAYMKANFPAEYMASILTAEYFDLEKVAEVVKECTRMGIEVLPPDVNESFEQFTYINEHQIRFGLKAVKNIGDEIIRAIVEERGNNGKFSDLEDFISRVHTKHLNKKSLESFAKAGALDSLAERNVILRNMDHLLAVCRELLRGLDSQQASLFGEVAAKKIRLQLTPQEPATQAEKLAWEKELLGLYVSSHPFAEYETRFGKTLFSAASLRKCGEGTKVIFGGLLNELKLIKTQKGDAMAFGQLEDLEGSVEAVFFPRVFEKYAKILKSSEVFLISGKISLRDNLPKILADEVRIFDQEKGEALIAALAKKMGGVQFPQKNSDGEAERFPSAEHVKALLIRYRSNDSMREQLKQILARSPGEIPVHLLLSTGNEEKRVAIPFKVSVNDSLCRELEQCFGSGKILLER